jgi:ComF family protein
MAGLDACAAGAAYAGEVEAWVRAFKYPPAFALPEAGPEELLGALLARAARGWLERDGLEHAKRDHPGDASPRVVPVPLHPRRLRRRGFNPAGLLARRLARRLELAFDPVALARARDTPSQTGLDARDRRRNVAGAFRFVGRGPAPARVLLVDDVVTTGATLAAAARALRRAGASSVVGLAAAATERRDVGR